MERPQPRVALGQALRGLTSSAIDVSDGLVGDLRHILRRSKVGARLHGAALPASAELARFPEAIRRECLLHGGDDYELLFTAPASRRHAVEAAGKACSVPVTCIGAIEAEPGLRLVEASGASHVLDDLGFDHFRA
jgi:thiamine-monophosphate kinase